MRRAKSFIIRKNKYNPDNGDNNNERHHPGQQREQQQKGHFINLKRSETKLVRRKSSSFDNIALLQDIEANKLYLQQRQKCESAEIINDKMDQKPSPSTIRVLVKDNRGGGAGGLRNEKPAANTIAITIQPEQKKLEKRISLSLDEMVFPLNQTEIRYNPDQQQGRLRASFQRIHTVDVIGELMTNFENGNSTSSNSGPNKLPQIPVPSKEELEGVELRAKNATITQLQQQRPIRSQTVNFDSSRTKTEQNFEIKGPCKIIINNEKCAKIGSNQKLLLTNNQLRIVENFDDLPKNSPKLQQRNNNQNNNQLLENNVEFRKNTIKLINKKDIEIKDTNNKQYLIQFEINKDAKQFYDTINNDTTQQTKITIKTKLRRLLGMRSSRDLLESKGILKNEPIFGNTLNDICNNNNDQQVPEFLQKIIELIELPANIKSLGIYRTSGNLAIIQKIRFEIDNGNINILNDYKDDVDVLTGCLKLFFRELKTLIIPNDVFDQLLELIIEQHYEQLEIFQKLDMLINQQLPQPNRQILKYLLIHLVKVQDYQQFNKMDVHNLSICWGPSLINNISNCENLVSQTNNITKIMEYLILYQKNQHNNNNNNHLKSVNLVDEGHQSKTYEIVKKLIDLIEMHIKIEGIYKKSGSEERKRWILQKIQRNQLNDLNYRLNNNNNNNNSNSDNSDIDVHDCCSALKKFLTTLNEPLIPVEMQEQFYKDCDNLDKKQLCEKLRKLLNNSPNKDILIILLKHIKKVQQFNNISTTYLLHYWTITLILPIDRNNLTKIEKFQYLLELLIVIIDQLPPLPDLIINNDKKQQRNSIYDNVSREATILDDNKTETKP